MECHYSVWGVLAFLSLALVVSLILNISHYMQKKQAKVYKDYEDNCPSYDDYYTEDDPVYGNLNQEECCYEQMKSQPQRPVNQLQVESANQMCYASLDHSIKGKRRKPRRKKDTSLEEDEEDRSCNPTTMASKVSIYLNSEQLAAENVEAIHDDPIR
ncbi:T-cell receptor-associated transmembrane adapter 1 isoform X2 [Grus americana]|uniref:T-cell receptor-associated transmembrane adapter 1-like isoform X2 n=1 Tax=Grus americana TaxID=9117 RepID=UPI002407DF8A|nr:T-cell receptor-associated transmembrane adapter 1-like isoform X2 [Grus americana]XP_054667908.1 T-cell receptor-associated transmembrane adapter 1 isoform X2 [Grus americana]